MGMLDRILRPLHASWGFYAFIWGILLGIILSLLLDFSFFIPFWIILLLIIFAIFSLPRTCGLIVAALFCSGLILGICRLSDTYASTEIIAQHLNQSVFLVGKLSEEPNLSKGITIRLQDLRLATSVEPVENFFHPVENSVEKPVENFLSQHDFTPINGNIYITLSDVADLERSDLVLLQGKLEAGFGTFVAKMSRPKLLAIERASPGDIFAQIKRWFATQVRELIPSPQVDLGLGYLMGLKSGLSADFASALQIVGMTHVVVASGAHLSILIGAAKKIFGKISKFAGLLGSLLLIASFVMIVGFTPSMTRAALVASLSLLVGYVGRKFTSLRLISFVAVVTLLINPTNFLNLGWQLSFASFFGILILAPRLQKSFYGGKQPPWLASMLLTSAATCLICAPILIYNFGSLSLLSFVANLIILPTLPHAMFLVFLTGILNFVPFLAHIFATLATWLLDLHIFVVNFLSEKTMFVLQIPSGQILVYLWYIVIIIYLLAPALYRYFRKSKVAPALAPEPLPREITSESSANPSQNPKNML